MPDGGWLQVGDAMQNNLNEPFDLLASTDCPRVIVAPTYRLNLFGFLASRELAELHEDVAAGNYGFWDQRMALEWTHKHISLFGGDNGNITVGGLSAGAYSSFFQLSYDSFLPRERRIIKRVYLWSNAVGAQPNPSTGESNALQFDELIANFRISPMVSAREMIAALRKIPFEALVNAIPSLKFHTFRATTDNSFVSSKFLSSIHDGSFAARLKENGTSLMLGEVADEGLLYRLVNPPSSRDGLVVQLNNYYPLHVVHALLNIYHLPDPSAPRAAWVDIFGQICGDCQVHAMIRGLAHSLLESPDPSHALHISSVHRYRIKWRAKALDEWLKPELRVCHAADEPIWWASGWRIGYSEEDKMKVNAFVEPFGNFLKGDEVNWGTENVRQIREMGTDGLVRVVQDDRWDWGLEVWQAMWDAQRDIKPQI